MFETYPDILTTKQTAEALAVSTQTVYELIKNGDISCIVIGRIKRIPKVSLIRFILGENYDSDQKGA